MGRLKHILLVLFLIFFITNVSAVDVSSCQDLDTADTTYDLISDISGDARCLNVTANGVTVNGAGYTLYYSQASNGEGIYIDGFNNTKIIDLNIINNRSDSTLSEGIQAIASFNLNITNVNLTIDGTNLANTDNHVIYLVDTTNTYIDNVNITTPTIVRDAHGIYSRLTTTSLYPNLTIDNSYIRVDGTSSSGIHIDASNGQIDNIIIKNTVIYSDDFYGIYIDGDNDSPADNGNTNITNVNATSRLANRFALNLFSVNEAHVYDSYFNTVSDVEIAIQSASQGTYTFVNSTYAAEELSAGTLVRKWYYDAEINATNGNPIENANITAYNVTGNTIFSLLSDVNGQIAQQQLIDYINTTGVMTYYNDYSINVSATGYEDNNTIQTISSSLFQSITLVDLLPPTITLDYPPNNTIFNSLLNIYLNYTVTDSQLDTVEIWHDFTGTFSKNISRTDVTSGVQAFNIFNISSDGIYTWNIWANDSGNLGQFNDTNFTFTIDTTPAVINTIDLSATAGSQNIEINVTSYTEINCFNAWYEIYKEDGTAETSVNQSFTSCTLLNDTYTVAEAPPNTYNVTIYMNDTAGNIGSKTQQISTTQLVIDTGTGGGGGGTAEEQIPVVGLQEINGTKSYSDLERIIIYSVINNYCSEKLVEETLAVAEYSDDCQLTNSDAEIIEERLVDLGINLGEGDFVLFFRNYKDDKIFQGFANKFQIKELSLFPSVLGITTLLQLNPPSIDTPVALYDAEGKNRTLSFIVTSNKPLKSCEILSQTPELTCKIQNSTIVVEYYLKDTKFNSRIFSGTLLVTSDAPSDKVEQKRLSVAFRVINLGWEIERTAIILGGILLISVIFIRRRSKKPVKKQIGDLLELR